MECANLINYLAESADKLVADAEVSDADRAALLLREAAELLVLGSAIMNKNASSNLSVITKEAA